MRHHKRADSVSQPETPGPPDGAALVSARSPPLLLAGLPATPHCSSVAPPATKGPGQHSSCWPPSRCGPRCNKEQLKAPLGLRDSWRQDQYAESDGVRRSTLAAAIGGRHVGKDAKHREPGTLQADLPWVGVLGGPGLKVTSASWRAVPPAGSPSSLMGTASSDSVPVSQRENQDEGWGGLVLLTARATGRLELRAPATYAPCGPKKAHHRGQGDSEAEFQAKSQGRLSGGVGQTWWGLLPVWARSPGGEADLTGLGPSQGACALSLWGAGGG